MKFITKTTIFLFAFCEIIGQQNTMFAMQQYTEDQKDVAKLFVKHIQQDFGKIDATARLLNNNQVEISISDDREDDQMAQERDQFSDNDVVALTTNQPTFGLSVGDLGTIVAVFSKPREAYEVEFVNDDGSTKALLTLLPDDIVKATKKN